MWNSKNRQNRSVNRKKLFSRVFFPFFIFFFNAVCLVHEAVNIHCSTVSKSNQLRYKEKSINWYKLFTKTSTFHSSNWLRFRSTRIPIRLHQKPTKYSINRSHHESMKENILKASGAWRMGLEMISPLLNINEIETVLKFSCYRELFMNFIICTAFRNRRWFWIMKFSFKRFNAAWGEDCLNETQSFDSVVKTLWKL